MTFHTYITYLIYPHPHTLRKRTSAMFFYTFVNILTTLHVILLTLCHRVKGLHYPRVGWFHSGHYFRHERRHVSLIVTNVIKGSSLYRHLLKGRFTRRWLVVMATVEDDRLHVNLYRPVKIAKQSGLVRLESRLSGEGSQFDFLIKDGHLVQPSHASSTNTLHQIGYFYEDPIASYVIPLTYNQQRELAPYIEMNREPVDTDILFEAVEEPTPWIDVWSPTPSLK